MELIDANRQWMNRPSDERYLDLPSMLAAKEYIRQHSRGVVVPSGRLTCEPIPDTNHKGLLITGPNGHGYRPTHWSFGQLASLVGAPSSYLRTLPAEMSADCLNYGLKVRREQPDVGCYLFNDMQRQTLTAATGPKYGRIYDADVIRVLIDRFGDGVTGQWRIPGEFGVQGQRITKENTTLYASDRDMWVFLADEERRITIPNRRNGQTGTLARGFFMWNSEVGSRTWGLCKFLFDYMCGNHIVWGVEQVDKVTIRHTSGAPDRFLTEIAPALDTYSRGTDDNIVKAIEDARSVKLGDSLDAFLNSRFTKPQVKAMVVAHELEEERPIETPWDCVVAATAVARGIPNMDDRIELEKVAGKILRGKVPNRIEAGEFTEA